MYVPLSCFITLNNTTPKALELDAFAWRVDAAFQRFPYPWRQKL
jgi:hypothetical protein